MRLITIRDTDDPRVVYGYCPKCHHYLELWASDEQSTCDHCNIKLHHIHSRTIFFLLIGVYFIVLFSLIYYLS